MRSWLAFSLVGVGALALGIVTAQIVHDFRTAEASSTLPQLSPTPVPTASPISGPAPEPSGDTVPVRLDLGGIEPDPTKRDALPSCGEPWDLEPVSAHGLSADAAEANQMFLSTGHAVGAGLVNRSEGTMGLIVAAWYVIAVQDGIVVSMPHDSSHSEWQDLQLGAGNYVLDPFESSAEQQLPFIAIDASMLCDNAEYVAALEAFEAQWDSPDDDFFEYLDAFDEFQAEHAVLPAGDYQIYAWAEVHLGEQAGAVRAWTDADFNVSALESEWPEQNDLLVDERVELHCPGVTSNDPPLVCKDIPGALWDELLTREVPVDYIIDVEPFVLISEPLIITAG